MKKWIVIVCGLSMFPAIGQQQIETSTEQTPSTEVVVQISLFEQEFAQVNNEFISVAMFKEFYAYATRNKFYHSKPPEDEVEQFAIEQKDVLINIVLAAQQAKKQSISVNNEAIAQKLLAMDTQYSESEQWQAVKSDFLPMYKRLLENQDLAAQFEKQLKQQVTLTEAQAKAFFEHNRDKFIQPPQNHLAIILLTVEPSAGNFVWQAVREQANDIHQQLVDGEDFATLAELYSTDVTADQGGNMGLVHRGMISEKVEQQLETMAPGDFTKPTFLLDGLAIFKLVDRKPETVHTFSEVKNRATGLATQAAIDKAWQDKLAQLRADASIQVHENFQ